MNSWCLAELLSRMYATEDVSLSVWVGPEPASVPASSLDRCVDPVYNWTSCPSCSGEPEKLHLLTPCLQKQFVFRYSPIEFYSRLPDQNPRAAADVPPNDLETKRKGHKEARRERRRSLSEAPWHLDRMTPRSGLKQPAGINTLLRSRQTCRYSQ